MATIQNSDTPNAEENSEWQELSFAVGGNTRWCCYFEKQYASYKDNIILLWLWVFVFLSVYTQRHKFMYKNKKIKLKPKWNYYSRLIHTS